MLSAASSARRRHQKGTNSGQFSFIYFMSVQLRALRSQFQNRECSPPGWFVWALMNTQQSHSLPEQITPRSGSFAVSTHVTHGLIRPTIYKLIIIQPSSLSDAE